MNPGRYFAPNMGMMGIRNVTPFAVNSQVVPRSAGLFSRIGSGIRSVNWGGLLNGANKTLNVVNQTIPLVKQAKPMFSNMRSMIRLAKAFGNETTSHNKNIKDKHNFSYIGNYSLKDNMRNSNNSVQTDNIPNDNDFPKFFI